MFLGKLHFYVGASDSFFLNDAVFLMQNFLDNEAPALGVPPNAEFRYGTVRGRGYMHAWSGSNETSMRINDLTLHQRLVPLAVEHMLATAPAGADVTSWRY